MKYTIALVAIFTILTGCSEEPPEGIERIILSTLLNSPWSSECVVDGTNSYNPIIIFSSNGGAEHDSGNGSSYNLYHTDNTTCSSLDPEALDTSTFSYSLGSTIVVDGTIAELTEATEIDTINTTEGSADLGAVEFDIFAIKDKYTLYFGDKTDPTNGTSTDLRPTQLTDSAIYTR